MRKVLVALALLMLSTPSFATYWIVMKDGSKYKAKGKWTVTNGKALIQLESGTNIVVDPAQIDVAKSDEATRLGGATVLAQEQPADAQPRQQSSLGSAIKLRKLQQQQQQEQQPAATPSPTSAVPSPTPAPSSVPATSGGSGVLGNEIVDKFSRAYENVGIFEQKVTSPRPHVLHVELTTDSEEKVFNAMSATAFLIMRNAGVASAQIDMVELFMRTTTGGAAGRFQMTRDDAAALDGKQMTREDYFVRKVIY